MDLLTLYTHDSKLQTISAIQSSVLQTLVSSVYRSLHYPFPDNGL
jgi:hypothetical protein